LTVEYQADGIPALRPRDVVNGKLSLSETARVSAHEYEIQSKRHRPAAGDIVYSRELSYGWAAALPKSPRVCLSQGMCLFRPNAEIETPFLLYVLNDPVGRQQAMHAAVGTAHPHINLGDIKGYRIPVPSLEKQREIVERLNVFSENTQRLILFYAGKLSMLSGLKQSILEKAFSGELTSSPTQAAKEAA
jgi:type I restriction enzyme, S subunit